MTPTFTGAMIAIVGGSVLVALVVDGLTAVWFIRRGVPRMADRIAERLLAQEVADRLWDRFVELERAEADASARSFEDVRSTVARTAQAVATMAARTTTPRDVFLVDGKPVEQRIPIERVEGIAEDATGPQERPEPVGATDEAEDGPEEHTEPLVADAVPPTGPGVFTAPYDPDAVPTFGHPHMRWYIPEDFEEPLRCSVPGGICGNRLLVRGEGFYEIPVPAQPDGSFLVVCVDDRIAADKAPETT